MKNVFPATSSQLDLLPPDYQHQVKLIDLWLDDGDALPHRPDWRVIASPAPTPESLCLYNPFTWELLCGDTMVIQSGAPLLRSGTNRYQLEETRRILHNLQVHYLYPTYGRCMLGLHPLNNISLE